MQMDERLLEFRATSIDRMNHIDYNGAGIFRRWTISNWKLLRLLKFYEAASVFVGADTGCGWNSIATHACTEIISKQK